MSKNFVEKSGIIRLFLAPFFFPCQGISWYCSFLEATTDLLPKIGVEKFCDVFYVQITTPNRLLEKIKLRFHSWSSLSSIMDAQMVSSQKSSFFKSQITSKKVIPRTTWTMLLVVEKWTNHRKEGEKFKKTWLLSNFVCLCEFFLVKTKGKLLKIKGNTSTKNLDNGTILLGYKKCKILKNT